MLKSSACLALMVEKMPGCFLQDLFASKHLYGVSWLSFFLEHPQASAPGVGRIVISVQCSGCQSEETLICLSSLALRQALHHIKHPDMMVLHLTLYRTPELSVCLALESTPLTALSCSPVHRSHCCLLKGFI